jgi:hypothetical protein
MATKVTVMYFVGVSEFRMAATATRVTVVKDNDRQQKLSGVAGSTTGKLSQNQIYNTWSYKFFKPVCT